jgi:hypothetical protein
MTDLPHNYVASGRVQGEHQEPVPPENHIRV